MPQTSLKTGGFQDYVTVAERIEKFYERYPEGRLITHIVEHDAERGFILMRAEVYRNADDAMPAATGHESVARGPCASATQNGCVPGGFGCLVPGWASVRIPPGQLTWTMRSSCTRSRYRATSTAGPIPTKTSPAPSFS